MSPLAIRCLGYAMLIGVPLLATVGADWLRCAASKRLARSEAAAPPRPVDDSWLLLPFQAVFMAAWLCWVLIAAGLFLAPLAAVLWVVLR